MHLGARRVREARRRRRSEESLRRGVAGAGGARRRRRRRRGLGRARERGEERGTAADRVSWEGAIGVKSFSKKTFTFHFSKRSSILWFFAFLPRIFWITEGLFVRNQYM